MAVADEIERIQGAKTSLKTSINAKTDAQHKITNETIDEYADFVDSIQTGSLQASLPDKVSFQNSSMTAFPTWLTDADTTALVTAENIFYNCTSLVTADAKKWNTKNVTTTKKAFYNCTSLVTADIENWNIDNVTIVDEMFSLCSNLTNIDVSKLAMKKVSSPYRMFYQCTSLSNNSLNSILAMCINSTGVGASSKKLSRLGLTSAQADVCATLSNWQAFLNAGWTSGY